MKRTNFERVFFPHELDDLKHLLGKTLFDNNFDLDRIFGDLTFDYDDENKIGEFWKTFINSSSLNDIFSYIDGSYDFTSQYNKKNKKEKRGWVSFIFYDNLSTPARPRHFALGVNKIAGDKMREAFHSTSVNKTKAITAILNNSDIGIQDKYKTHLFIKCSTNREHNIFLEGNYQEKIRAYFYCYQLDSDSKLEISNEAIPLLKKL